MTKMKNALIFLFLSLAFYSQGQVKISAMTSATDLTGTVYLPVVQGGTNKKVQLSTTPAATMLALWDANKNIGANAFPTGWTSTATAAGTTTLTIGSTQGQTFTGSTTQTVTLPVASTCSTNPQTIFTIINLSSGTVTVNSSGANVVQSMAANSYAIISCILTSGTTAASWNVLYYPSNPMTAVGDVPVGGTVVGGVATPSKISPSTLGWFLRDRGAGVAPDFGPATSDMIVASSTNTAATAGNIGETVTGTPVTSYTNFTTSATYKNISSVVLPAGDWIVEATFTLYGNGATVTTSADAIFVVSTTTASATGSTEGLNKYYIPQNDFVTSTSAHISGKITFHAPPSSSQVTWYLNGQATYSVGNMQYVGSITGWRPR